MSSIGRAFLVLACVAVSACQSVTLVYRFRTMTLNELAIIDSDLRNGTLRTDSPGVGDFASCDALATSGISLALQRDSSGTLQNGTLKATALTLSQHDTSPPNVPCDMGNTLPSLKIDTGRGLTIGTADRSGTAAIYVNNTQYTNTPSGAGSLFYKFTIDSRDPNSGLATGSFEFLGRNADDLNDLRVIIVRAGTFSINAP